MRTKVGARIRTERKAKKFSQADLEERCGVARCRISWLENGRAVPTIETLERIADALEVPLYQLFRDSEQPTSAATAAERIATKGRAAHSKCAGRGRFVEVGRELRNLCEDDQDLLLYIARGLVNRAR